MGSITLGTVTHDVYGTAQLIKDYFNSRIGAAAWDDAASADKNKAHITATRIIENVLSRKLAAANVPDPSVDPAPEEIQYATYEYALVLLTDATAQNNADSGSNIKKVVADTVSVEFFTQTIQTSSVFPENVQRWLSEYCAQFGSSGSFGPEATGTDGVSGIPQSNDFGLNRGFA